MEVMRHRGYQWYETTEKVMIIDTISGERYRFGEHKNVIGSLEEALDYVKRGGLFLNGPTDRLLIVRLDAIAMDLLSPVNEEEPESLR